MAVQAFNNDAARRTWLLEGMASEVRKTFWAPLTGSTFRSAVFQTTDLAAKKAGHTVVFQFGGALSGRAIRGKETAYGKGEIKRQFTDKIIVDRYRIPVNNDDEFDAVNIGNMKLSEHSNAMKLLSEHFAKFKDQQIFDAMQGVIGGAPTHRISYRNEASGHTFGYSALLDLEEAIKTGEGVNTSTAGVDASYTERAPIKAVSMENDMPMWFLVVDSAAKNVLLKDDAFQRIATGGDVRGRDNILLKGVIGKVGNLMVMEAGSFYGKNVKDLGAGNTVTLDGSEVELAGLRRFSSTTSSGLPAIQGWRGDTDYSTSGDLWSRCLLVGQSAAQVAFGKMPDYKFQLNPDFGIDSGSVLETWMGVKKTKLQELQGDDYDQAKLVNTDFGVIAVDVQTKG